MLASATRTAYEGLTHVTAYVTRDSSVYLRAKCICSHADFMVNCIDQAAIL